MRLIRLLCSAGLCGLALAVAAPTAADDAAASDGKKSSSLFDQLDTNGDGVATAEEVPEKSRRFFDRLLEKSDANDDGKLTAEEFGTATADRGTNRRGGEGGMRPEGMRRGGDRPSLAPQSGGPDFDQFFSRLDKNGDGSISRDEIPEDGPGARLGEVLERTGKDSVSREELEQLRERMQRGGREGMTRGGPGGEGMGRRPEGGPRDGGPREGGPRDGGPRDGGRPGFGGPGMGGPGGPGAGGPGGPGGPGRFMQNAPILVTLDGNGDGTLSKEEFATAADKFDQLDSNNDGQLDLPELMMSADMRDRMQQMRERGGDRGFGRGGDRGGDRGGRPGDRGGRGGERGGRGGGERPQRPAAE